ncbi:MAG: hypothetical protein Q9163_002520 [Psora crenata]
MASQPPKRKRDDENSLEVPRPRKRPGASARISRVEAEAVQHRQQQRAAEAAAAVSTRGVEEVVRQHYNAVPQRGRDWRKTDSRIKGLRSFNNWIKSTIIHKFSPNEDARGGDSLNVLDIGCGKGGDLGKWAQAPQPVGYYVGVDVAEVSIDQARERYMQMRPGGGGRGGHQGGRHQRIFDATFLVEDAFTYSLGDLPIIQQIGFGAGSRWGPSGGFDVVSMMFCMHYAFESEAKAKGMLSNVARSLRRGGRLLGVIPNSDVLREGVIAFHERKASRAKRPSEEERPKSEAIPNGRTASEARPPSPSEGTSDLNGTTEPLSPRRSSTATKGDTAEPLPAVNEQAKPTSAEWKKNDLEVAEWGNSIYHIRFPGGTPSDGIFRPPYGWKYSYFMEEAVEEVPEYVVPWEAFRAIAEDYNLELQYRKPFREIWEEEGNSPVFGPLSERMGVRGRDGGDLLVTEEEMEAASRCNPVS